MPSRFHRHRDEEACRRVYSQWAGHGDPEGFDFSWEVYVIPQKHKERIYAN